MAFKNRTLAAYGQIALPLAIADLPLVIYLVPFFTGDIGIPIAIFGVIALIARGADVLIDPMIGILSDRSGGLPLGRRKFWVVFGVPVKMLGIYFIFFATQGVSEVYVLGWLVVLYLGWTMIQTPYGAWGAELSGDYIERTRITAWRTLFTFIGILIATLAPIFILIGSPGLGLMPVMHSLGLWALIAFPISALIIGTLVPEPVYRPSTPISWAEGIKVVLRNGPYMRILISTFVGRIGAAVNAATVVWFFSLAMRLPNLDPYWVVTVYLIAAVIGVPLWVKLGDRFSKHNALIFAVVFSVLCFAVLLVIPQGQTLLACIVMALCGLGGGAAGTLGLSIAADVLDLDEMRSRKSRAGLLIAFWNMAGKFADAIGIFVALTLLASFGFDPTKGPANSPEAISGLTLTYIIIPWPFYLVSVLLLWRFPIDRAKQVRIRSLIDRRAARTAAAAAAQ